MAAEIKTRNRGGKCIETYISPAAKLKLMKYCKKNNISQAQYLRDLVQGALKK